MRTIRHLLFTAVILPVVTLAGADPLPVVMFCGAGLRPPVEEIIREFRKEQGIEVQVSYGGSAQMLAQLEMTGKGDLFLPGEEWYLDMAERKKLLGDGRTVLAVWTPVIMVAKGNPRQITGLPDLARPGLRVGLGDERAAAIGVVSARILEKVRYAAAIRQNVVVRTTTVNDLGNALKLGTVDAVIVWDSIAALYPAHGQTVPLPEEVTVLSRIVVAPVRGAANAEGARRLTAFCTGEKGRAIFVRHHYRLPAK